MAAHFPARQALLLAAALCAVAHPALAFELKSCADAGIGLESIVDPVARNHLRLYDGKVTAYNVDTVEPACCSSGIAVVFPDKEDESGGSACEAVIGMTSVDVTAARRSYDQAKGLLLELDTRTAGGDGALGPGKALRLRVNLATSTVTLEP